VTAVSEIVAGGAVGVAGRGLVANREALKG